jgi:hypothetical protein
VECGQEHVSIMIGITIKQMSHNMIIEQVLYVFRLIENI